MKATLRKMGNSQGVLIPKAIVEQLGIQLLDEMDMSVEDGAIVLRKPSRVLSGDAAVAAIEFAMQTDEGMNFLRCWIHGDFDVIRKEWPEAPEAVFIGADSLYGARLPGNASTEALERCKALVAAGKSADAVREYCKVTGATPQRAQVALGIR